MEGSHFISRWVHACMLNSGGTLAPLAMLLQPVRLQPLQDLLRAPHALSPFKAPVPFLLLCSPGRHVRRAAHHGLPEPPCAGWLHLCTGQGCGCAGGGSQRSTRRHCRLWRGTCRPGARWRQSRLRWGAGVGGERAASGQPWLSCGRLQSGQQNQPCALLTPRLPCLIVC